TENCDRPRIVGDMMTDRHQNVPVRFQLNEHSAQEDVVRQVKGLFHQIVCNPLDLHLAQGGRERLQIVAHKVKRGSGMNDLDGLPIHDLDAGTKGFVTDKDRVERFLQRWDIKCALKVPEAGCVKK